MDIEKALVVDDSKVVQFKLKRMLETRGIRVDTAASGLEALNYLKSQAPQVIFMDCMMPDMDGYEATSVIKATPAIAGIAVIMCTGHDTPEEQQRAREVGAVDYIVKPFDDAVLDGALARLRTGAASANQASLATHATMAIAPSAPVAAATVARARPPAPTVPVQPPAADVVAESARIAERIAAEVAARVLREATPSLAAAIERAAGDIAREVATGVARESLQSANAHAQSARASDSEATQTRLREILAEAVATAEHVARQVSETTIRAIGEQSARDSLSQSSHAAADLQASVGRTAAEVARQVTQEQLQPALDAAQAARLSAQASSEARFAEAVSTVQEAAGRATREALHAAQPELQQMIREMVDVAHAQASRNAPPALSRVPPAVSASEPDRGDAAPPPAPFSRAVVPWLAGLSLAVLYLLVRSLT